MTDEERISDYLHRLAELSNVPVPLLDRSGVARLRRARPGGDSIIEVALWKDVRSVQLRAPIMNVPDARREELFRFLLELNHRSTDDGAFSIDGDPGRIYLRALRPLEGLDFNAFAGMVATVTRVADEWDERLRAQFNGSAPAPSVAQTL